MKTILASLVVSMAVVLAVPGVSASDTPTAPVAASDVSGAWDFVVETAQGSGTPVFTFKQDGAKLTGTYKGQFGQAPVTGTIKGNAVSFSVTVNADEPLKIEYAGTVDGDTMKGTTKFGSYGDGTFSAKRKAK